MDALGSLKWLVIIFVGLWIVWFFTGGPQRETSQGGIFIEPASHSQNSWKTYSNGFSLFGNKTSNSENSPDKESIAEQLDDAENELKQIRRELEKAQEIAGSSVYRDKIILKYGNAKRSDVDEEYLIIKSSRNNEGRIGITNWTIGSVVTGKKITIGKSSYLPYTSRINTQEPIYIYPGDKVYITTGRSPIGTSFRTNICTGYLEQFQNFNPSLKRSCPLPEDENDFVTIGPNAFNDQCIDYIEGLPRCEINTKTLPLTMQNECITYIGREINYNSCVDKHKSDPDFYGSEWRIFLNRGDELWKSKRETIKLLDANGKLVDTVTY